ncbi:hypothetical protein [Polaribacter aestuariivivens]|uniref:hypothetical protein n=1 Tax=Polaribacter aestuariivivens TaxID=2304626 RepID=UPI003F4954FB
MIGNNINVEMTRRYFDLPRKVALRDSKIAKQIINAWDFEQDKEKVFKLFVKNCDKLSSQRYWELLRTVWIVCGNLENVGMFKLLMNAKKKKKYCFSTPEEAKLLREMPDEFKVYRACNEKDDGGISWTYSKDYAFYYKDAFNKKRVLEHTVKREDVFALINRNQEYEILLLPKY